MQRLMKVQAPLTKTLNDLTKIDVTILASNDLSKQAKLAKQVSDDVNAMVKVLPMSTSRLVRLGDLNIVQMLKYIAVKANSLHEGITAGEVKASTVWKKFDIITSKLKKVNAAINQILDTAVEKGEITNTFVEEPVEAAFKPSTTLTSLSDLGRTITKQVLDGERDLNLAAEKIKLLQSAENRLNANHQSLLDISRPEPVAPSSKRTESLHDLPNSPDTSKLRQNFAWQQAGKPLSYGSGPDTARDERNIDRSAENYTALKSIQSSLRAIPKSIPDGQEWIIVKAPIYVTTTPYLTDMNLKRAGIEYELIAPGYILLDQIMFVTRSSTYTKVGTPTTRVMTPKGITAPAVGLQAKREASGSKTEYQNLLNGAIKALSMKTESALRDMLDGEILTNEHVRGLAFTWLLEANKYSIIGPFSVTTKGLPFAKKLTIENQQSAHELNKVAQEKSAKQSERVAKRGNLLHERVERKSQGLLERLAVLKSELASIEKQKEFLLSSIDSLDTAEDLKMIDRELATTLSPKRHNELSAKKATLELKRNTLIDKLRNLEQDVMMPARAKQRELAAQIEEIMNEERRKLLKK